MTNIYLVIIYIKFKDKADGERVKVPYFQTSFVSSHHRQTSFVRQIKIAG